MEGVTEGERKRQRERGKRHAIICRSLTSTVNPQSRLTLLIKEVIKGPPPELLRKRRERKRRKGQKHRETGRWSTGKSERSKAGRIWVL